MKTWIKYPKSWPDPALAGKKVRIKNAPAPAPIPGVPMVGYGYETPWHAVTTVGGLGDTPASMVYSALGMAQAALAPVWRSITGAPAAPATPTVTTITGGNMASLFSGGGASLGSTDWGGILGSVANTVAGIYSTKAQTKQLKQLNRLIAGQSAMAGLMSQQAGFAPATVPAATGAGWGLGGLLGGAAAAGAGALGLLPNLLPGGLEESGTGLFGPDLFAPTQAGARQRMIDAPHPTTGERVYWRPVGRPIMFAGDKTLLLRTRKVVRKLSSSAGCGVARSTFRRRRRR